MQNGRGCEVKEGDIAGMESHAGQVFTCVGALALAGSLHLLDRDLLCWWCAHLQAFLLHLLGIPQ